MQIFRLLIISIWFLVPFASIAQDGFIRGTVYDDEIGETIPGANVYIEGTSIGCMTDLDGKFNIKVAPGTYQLKVSFISFETITISNIEVKAGAMALFDNIRLKSSSIALQTVVVSAKQVRNTEVAIATMKKKSPTLLDGISSATLKKTGDSDAAASIKRVAGVSVAGGKYVFVRGLGDRYSKTILNGMEIPGLDPDRNTIQMDIFPTSIIDNIVVYKSFSADLPADFTGGIVNLELKDFPEERRANVSVGLGYSPQMHFKSDYLTYKGGKLDFLGFDDGARAIPAINNIPSRADVIINQGGDKERYMDILKSFNPNMAAIEANSLMDFSLGFDYGDQKPLGKYSLGYNLSVSYSNETSFLKGVEYNRFAKNNDNSINEMLCQSRKFGQAGINNVLWSGLGGLALKSQNSKIRLNILHIQNGESKASILDQERNDKGTDFLAYIHNLEYQQRSLSNLLLDGKSSFDDTKWELVWKVSPTLSKIKSPDIRTTRYTDDNNDGNYVIHGGAGDYPKRSWRNLEEYNISGLAQAVRKYQFRNHPAKLKFGGNYTYKSRDFVIRQYQIIPTGIDDFEVNPNELFYEDNLMYVNGSKSQGVYFDADFYPNNTNQFSSNISNAGGFVSTEIKPINTLSVVAGIRTEFYTQRYTGDGKGVDGDVSLNNDKVVDDIDFFPALNLIYALTEKQNLRLSYSQTIARPSFKEMSYAQIYDPITGVEFNGGMYVEKDETGKLIWDGNLVSTDIQNFDFRWGNYFKGAEMVSLSAFYKMFKSPIEMFQYTIKDRAVQPRNVGDGYLLGAELEFRKQLGFISNAMKDVTFSTNFTYTTSRIEMSDVEYQARLSAAREGESVDKYRQMAGMSPYLINAGFQYKAAEESRVEGLELGLFYNVQGEALDVVGIGIRPDIYTQAFHSLNLTASYGVGKQKKLKFGFKVKNMLNQEKASVYKSFRTNNQFYSREYQGIAFSFKVSYALC